MAIEIFRAERTPGWLNRKLRRGDDLIKQGSLEEAKVELRSAGPCYQSHYLVANARRRIEDAEQKVNGETDDTHTNAPIEHDPIV